MYRPFSVPVYEPSPYAFCGYSLQDLPCIARHYLTNVAQLVHGTVYDDSAIQEEHSRLAFALFRSLQGVDMALVEKRRETRMSAKAQLEMSDEWRRDAEEKDEERLQEIVSVLLPERQILLDEFMIKFDALVWFDLDLRLRVGMPECPSSEEQMAYRDVLCKPILAHTCEALVALDQAVVGEEMRRGGKLDAAAPKIGDGWDEGPADSSWEYLPDVTEQPMMDIQNTPPKARTRKGKKSSRR